MGSNWQPTETAPDNEFVLISDELGDMYVAHSQFGYWYTWIDWIHPDLEIKNVTHWMPLPEAPTQQEVDNGN